MVFANARRIVIKVGSALIADEASGCVRTNWLSEFAKDTQSLRAEGKQVVIVTSGAIALGRAQLGLKPKAALTLEEKQAAAACGQIELFSAWRDAFSAHHVRV
ncbi:MAG: glutamate 5-kinase, partial [Proteobacteria bacterium]|nr:glutamate 5-kinase [Pseudomonadota bacterium]